MDTGGWYLIDELLDKANRYVYTHGNRVCSAMKVDEWEPSQIKNRIERFEKARDGVLSRDPQGAFPEVARIDARLAELRRRAERAAAAPATADGGS